MNVRKGATTAPNILPSSLLDDPSSQPVVTCSARTYSSHSFCHSRHSGHHKRRPRPTTPPAPSSDPQYTRFSSPFSYPLSPTDRLVDVARHYCVTHHTCHFRALSTPHLALKQTVALLGIHGLVDLGIGGVRKRRCFVVNGKRSACAALFSHPANDRSTVPIGRKRRRS
jgi:hypothetical protein